MSRRKAVKVTFFIYQEQIIDIASLSRIFRSQASSIVRNLYETRVGGGSRVSGRSSLVVISKKIENNIDSPPSVAVMVVSLKSVIQLREEFPLLTSPSLQRILTPLTPPLLLKPLTSSFDLAILVLDS